MGEIGIPRREFLYDIQFWEARRIIRGYQRRNILQYQLQRMNMWASMFCMGNPNHKEPQDILHLYFDDWDDDDADEPISEEDKQELVDLMNRMNEQQTTPADESADKKQE